MDLCSVAEDVPCHRGISLVADSTGRQVRCGVVTSPPDATLKRALAVVWLTYSPLSRAPLPKEMVKLTIVEDRPTPKEVYNWKVYFYSCMACWASVMIGYDVSGRHAASRLTSVGVYRLGDGSQELQGRVWSVKQVYVRIQLAFRQHCVVLP